MTAEACGEIEELERLVQSAAGSLSRTAYLPNNPRVFLEETAHRCRSGDSPVLDVALASARLDWPAELAASDRRQLLTGLLTGCGVFVAEHGDLRFASPAIRDYLAAGDVVRHHPRGPRRTAPGTWKYLAPQKRWPWPDAGLCAFVAALWWRTAQPAVRDRLHRLLRERHWDPNIGFVVELVRRGLVPDGDLRDKAVDVLRRALRDPGLADDRWAAAAGEFRLVDPAVAAGELEALVSLPPPAIRSRRRYEAVLLLSEDDPVRGREALEVLAWNLTGTPQDRFDTAIAIAGLDHEQGVVAMLTLAGTEDMGDLRADAAIFLRRPGLLHELVAGGRTLSDDARLRALAELTAVAPETAVTAAERFAGSCANQLTPLLVAELIRPVDRAAALRMAAAVAEWEDRNADSEVRYRAVLLIGEIEPAEAVPALRRLSGSGFATFEVRLRAAARILTEYGGPTDALVALATDRRVAWADQAEAAEALKEADPETSAQLLVAIAKSGPPADAGRFALLERAHRISSSHAAAAIVDLVRNRHTPGPLRLRAAELIGPSLDTRGRVALYAEIVATADGGSARQAARKVIAMHHPDGLRLMAQVADRTNEDAEFRLTAAVEAGAHGKHVLRSLVQTAPSDEVRLAAARALAKIDRTSGEAALKHVVMRATTGQVRLEAALDLPGTEALTYLVRDEHAKDELRLEAALRARQRDGRHGRKLVEALANHPRISRQVREMAQYHLGR